MANLVPENINEGIKHLKPRKKKELEKWLNAEVKRIIQEGLSGKENFGYNIVYFLEDAYDINVERSQVTDDIIISFYYDVINKNNEIMEKIIKDVIINSIIDEKGYI